jgi:hypothetical protein
MESDYDKSSLPLMMCLVLILVMLSDLVAL